MICTNPSSAVLIAVLFLSFSSLLAQTSTPDPVSGWPTSSPEAQGIDSGMLAQALAFALDQQLPIHSILMIRHGYSVLDTTFPPFVPATPHDLASGTKSVTATLIAVALQKGLIDSLDQPVLSFFPDRTVQRVDERKREMTVRHLLTMTSGLECRDQPQEQTRAEMFGSPDWVQFMLDRPMSEDPGSRFNYCNGVSHLLSAIIKERTGENTLAFARKHLFGPLGITDVSWPEDPSGVNWGWGDLRMLPQDMAKIGYLYLKNGVWNGEQILPPDWVTESTRAHVTHTGSTNAYGLHWWISHEFGFLASGRGGQWILVAPAADVVIVFTAAAQNGEQLARQTEIVKQFLAPAIRPTALQSNPEHTARLKAALARAVHSEPTAPLPVRPLPDLAKRVSGIKIEVAPNPFLIRDIYLTLGSPAEGKISLDVARERIETPVGLDGIPRKGIGRGGIMCLASGSWESDAVFVLSLNEVGNISQWCLRLDFGQPSDTVAITFEGTFGKFPFTGKLIPANQ